MTQMRKLKFNLRHAMRYMEVLSLRVSRSYLNELREEIPPPTTGLYEDQDEVYTCAQGNPATTKARTARLQYTRLPRGLDGDNRCCRRNAHQHQYQVRGIQSSRDHRNVPGHRCELLPEALLNRRGS